LRVLNKVVSKPEYIDNLIPVNSTAIKLADAFAEKRRFEEAIRTYRWVKPRGRSDPVFEGSYFTF
jgi:hypothetical protein